MTTEKTMPEGVASSEGLGLAPERDALAGLVGWAQMILAAGDMPPKLRGRFADNHRLTTAVIALAAPATTCARCGTLARCLFGMQSEAIAHCRPLTNDAICALWSWSMTAEAEQAATTQQHAFARAVERAHGIGA